MSTPRLLVLLVDRQSIAALSDATKLGVVLTSCGVSDDDILEIRAIGESGYIIRPGTPGFSPTVTGMQLRDPGPRAREDTTPIVAGVIQSQAVLNASGDFHPTFVVNLADDRDGRIGRALNAFVTVITVTPQHSFSTLDARCTETNTNASPATDLSRVAGEVHSDGGELPPDAGTLPTALKPPKIARRPQLRRKIAAPTATPISTPIAPQPPKARRPVVGLTIHPGARRPGTRNAPGAAPTASFSTAKTAPEPTKPQRPVVGLTIRPGARRPGTENAPVPAPTERIGIDELRQSMNGTAPSNGRRGFTELDPLAKRPPPMGHSVTICAAASMVDLRRAVHAAVTVDIRFSQREYRKAGLTFYAMEPLDVGAVQTENDLFCRPTAAVALTWGKRKIDVVFQEHGQETYAWFRCSHSWVEEPSVVRHNILGFKGALAVARRTVEILTQSGVAVKPLTLRRNEPW